MKFLRLLPLLLLLVPTVACQHGETVPQALVGNWVTDDARYEGKTLMIDPKFIVLCLNDTTMPKAERIDRMTSESEAGVSTYVFETTDQQGLHDKIKVMYRPIHGGELRLSHPSQVVWRRGPLGG